MNNGGFLFITLHALLWHNSLKNLQMCPGVVPKEEYKDKGYYTFNTHWYETLTREGPKNIVRWVDNSILGRMFLIFPIHYENHWSVFIVVYPGLVEKVHRRRKIISGSEYPW